MKSTTFTAFFSYLSCGLILITLAAPSPFVGADLLKRGHHHHHHAASHKATRQNPDAPQPGVATLMQPRDTLAFNAEFDQYTAIPGIKFSAVQFYKRSAKQKTEEFWLPKEMDTTVAPSKYFHQACLDTPTGQIFKRAMDGHILTTSQVNLINVWGTFSNQYKEFKPWQWSEDGIMAVSCQLFSIKVDDIPLDQAKEIDSSKFKVEADSSSQMIANLRKNGFTVNQITEPSHTRAELEHQIKANKKKSI